MAKAFSTVLSTTNVRSVSSVAVTPAATITYTIPNADDLYSAWTAGQDETINLSGTQFVQQVVVFVITNDATPRAITFGTGFRVTAKITGLANKISTITFISDGTNMIETARAVGM